MQNYIKTGLMLGVLGLLTSGCTLFGPEYIYVNPAINTSNATNIGHGKKITLIVNDERANPDIGDGSGISSTYQLSSNTLFAMEDAVSNGLTAYGFKPVSGEAGGSGNNTQLSITLTRLNREAIYQTFGNTIGSILLNSTIRVDAARGGVHYQKTYRAELNITGGWHQETDPKVQISQVLSRNIDRIFFDRDLMTFLAK